ncbi:HSP20 family protein [Scopulibacillus darangshiensis]|uniref:HSP20 family protein n=1 Tax=Scopulibacillus darangshiensis TaxID=442528 RepID=A0A4R2NQG8_9BACL|nr:Hsp20/alpha crystallin family protein [Scopulibacillus darangshiensis]TCP24093.1 HSP20 family protein [Scopulibacillus darangshiensis]
MKETKFQDWKKSVSGFLGKEFWQDFQDVFMKEWPLVNVYESQNYLLCLIALPGLEKKEDVHIYVNHQSITLRGVINSEISGYQPVHEEFSNGRFERSIELPYPVHQVPSDASYKKGLLTLVLQRLQDREVSEVVVMDEDD